MGYKTKAEEEKEKALWDEGFPKSVYHKNFEADCDEKHLLKNHKVVYTEAALKKLGPDWGDHPSVKVKEVQAEVKPEVKKVKLFNKAE